MNDYPHHNQKTESSSADQAAEEAKSLKDEAAAKAKNVRDSAYDAAKGTAEDAKANVADEISNVGDALRRASDELRDGSPQERTFGQMASTLADFSDTVRNKDMGEMAEDVSNFARRNPVAFLGGAALLGFAGVRMAKASQRKRDRDEAPDHAEPRYETASTMHTRATPAAHTAPNPTPKPGV